MTEFLVTGPAEGPTLVLAHGSSAPMDSPFLTDLAELLAGHGVRVIRFEFPYMVRRRKGPPDRQPVLLGRWSEVLAEIGSPSELLIGGKSLGGRMASMIADEEGVRGLVCLGYPFHPPGRPDKLRTAHLADLRTPTLIVQGERDPFGTRDEVASFDLSARISFAWMPDGDHSFKPRKRSGFTPEGNLAAAATAIAAFATP